MTTRRYWVRRLLAISCVAIASVAGQNTVNYAPLFIDPYRDDAGSVVSNPMFAAMKSANTIAISYHGWAQVSSAGSSSSSRPLLSVRPSQTSSTVLPSVYILNQQYLAADITTTSGTETFVGPTIKLDAWFSFGITIVNSASSSGRYVLLYYSNLGTSTSSTQWFAMKGNMFATNTAVAVAPIFTSTTPDNGLVYVASVRVFDSALNGNTFDWGGYNFPPPTYTWQVGSEVRVFGFDLGNSNANVSCPNNQRISSVTTALYGRSYGLWPNVTPASVCNAYVPDSIATVKQKCVNKLWCIVPQTISDWGVDPCPNQQKWTLVALTCGPLPSSSSPTLSASRSVMSSMPTPGPSPTSSAPSPTSSAPSSPSKPVSRAPSSPSKSSSVPSSQISSSSSVSANRFALSSSSSSMKAPSTASLTASSSSSSRLSFPLTSSSVSNPNAWQISLVIGFRSVGLSDSDRLALINGFVADMSAALSVPKTRFGSVSLQTQTPSLTLLSFVVFPSATDVDASLVVRNFTLQMQTVDSVLRSGTLLVFAGDPPVSIQVVGLRAFNCGTQYVVSPNPCPTAAALSSSKSESIWRVSTVVYAGGACVLLFIIATLWCCCFKPRKKDPNGYERATTLTTGPIHTNTVSLGTTSSTGTYHIDAHGVVHGTLANASRMSQMPVAPPIANHARISHMLVDAPMGAPPPQRSNVGKNKEKHFGVQQRLGQGGFESLPSDSDFGTFL